jgi:hypothetical protein
VLLVCSVLVLDIGGQSRSAQDAAAAAAIQGPGAAGAPVAPVGQNPVLKARLQQMYATADFNGDGLQDVALVDFLTDSVRVMTAEPGGTFRITATLAARRGPRSIVAADFNGDRVPDLAVAEFLSGEISVFGGRVNGQFEAARTVRVGEGVNSIIAHDLDGDARRDIVAANALSGAVLLLKNAGDGSFDAPAEIGRANAVTILAVDVDDDGVQDLAALNANGTDARVFAGRGAGRFAAAKAGDVARVLSAATAGAARTTTSASIARLNKMAGDGVAQQAGTAAAEPLVVEVRDSSGMPVADGQVVVFSRVGGNAESAEPGALPGRIEDVRGTNELGRASLALTVPGLPEVSFIAAALPADQVVHFGMISILTQQELAGALEAALALEVSDDIEREERIGLLRQASERLNQGEAIEGVRVLRTLLNQLPSEQTGPDATGFGAAADLSRRFINQVLLTGVTPAVAENEALVCDVALTRTIATPTEVDRFKFACQAGEIVHITLGNHGGSFGFNPQWRLLGPETDTPAAVCGTFSEGARQCTVLAAGLYAVEVIDGASNATGTYSVHLQRLSPAQRCGGSIACDAALTTTIDAFADTDLHGFIGVAGEIVHLSLGNHGGSFGFNPQWRLVAPAGTPATVCGTLNGADGECTLPAAGPYAVEVIDGGFNATGTYSLHLQRLTAAQRCTGSITCDAPLTTTINAFADTDLHGFTGVPGEIVHVSLGNHGGSFGFNPQWRLLAPAGTPATVCGILNGADGECTLPAAGAYAIEVIDAGFNATGTYSLHLQRLTAAQRCTGSITCDTALTTTIEAFADTDLHGFTGVAGEIVHVSLGNHGGSFGFNPQWRLLAPNGTPATVCGILNGADGECTLPVAGAYAIEVIDAGFNATGTYSLHLQRLTAGQRCGGSLTCGVPIVTTISAFADTDLHSFTGIGAKNVHVSLLNRGGSFGFNPQWRLLASDGRPAEVCGTWSEGGEFDCMLPRDSSYAVEVRDGAFNAAGTYSLTVSGPGCINPPSTTITVSAVDPLAIEAGLDRGVVRLTRTGSTNSALTVDYAVGGTAIGGIDYTALSGRAVIQAGAGFTDVAVVPLSDTIREAEETVILTLTPPVGPYTIGTPGAAAVTITDGPDLIISALAAPIGTQPGETINITIGSRNQGTRLTGQTTTTRIWLSINSVLDPGDTLLDGYTVSAGLAPNTTNTVTRTVKMPAVARSKHYLIAQADALNVQPEANEGNNTRAKAITIGTDYIISSIVAPIGANPGQTIDVTVGTRNQGTVTPATTITRIWLSANSVLDVGDTLLAGYEVLGLAANITNTVTTAVRIPADTPRSKRHLIAQADALDVLDEPVETNNTRTKAITMGADYSIVALSPVPTSIPAGSAFTIVDTTKNSGGPVAMTTTTQFYLSSDSVFSPITDVRLAQRTVPPLTAGESSSASTPATLPTGTAPGTKYLIAVGDGLSQVAEVSETNNRKTVAITVP